MNYISDLFSNRILVTAAAAWAAAQLIKIILTLITERRFDFTRITGTGGMPSSHSSFTVSLAAAIGFEEGFANPLFALSAAFAIVTMYDAAGIRRSAGQQAVILNRIMDKLGREDIAETGKKLKELLGHTPVQVVAGAALGIFIAILRHAL